MNSGIYAIINSVNNKIYIGQSRNLSARKRLHFHHLIHNTHRNRHLQAAFNRYGPLAFRFLTLAACPPNSLDAQEIRFISLYCSTNPEFGYNTERGGLTRPIASGTTRLRMQQSQSKRRSAYLEPLPSLPDQPDKPDPLDY